MSESAGHAVTRFRPRPWHWLLGGVAVLAGLGWAGRIGIADRLIGGALADLHLPGRYTVVAVGPGEQVLADVALGDPAHPDLTARRLVIATGLAGITGVRAEGVRLHGRVVDGRLTFGGLDPFLNRPATSPLRLPDWPLTLIDARAAIGGELGPVGLALSGSGGLADGFAGRLAVAAPRLEARHCRITGLHFAGQLATHAGAPGLAGPLTAQALACPQAGVAMDRPVAQIAGQLAASLDAGTARLGLASGPLQLAALRAGGGTGSMRLALSGGRLTGDYTLALAQAQGAGLAVQRLAARGDLAGSGGHLRTSGQIEGTGAGASAGTLAALDRAARAAQGTMAGPLLGQLATTLRREGGASRLSAQYNLNRDGDHASLVVPAARLVGARGGVLATASGLVLGPDGGIGGNLRLVAPLPALTARLAAVPGGTTARLELADWAGGGGRLAMPRLDIAYARGRAHLAGLVRASGAVPGGSVDRLELPVDGSWSAGGGLVLGQRCATARFAGAHLAALSLGPGAVPLCPDGPAMLAGGRLAARAPQLALAGRLGAQPFALAGGPLRLGGAGFGTGPLAVTLGQGDTASRFSLAGADGQWGAMAGHFRGGAVMLAPVPMDLATAAGNWRWADGRLVLAGLGFAVADRALPGAARFEPLVARDGTLTLADGRISAAAALRHPASDRVITEVRIDHRLADAAGSARLVIPGLVFDGKVQPDMLSHLALGVVANVAGTVRGAGRIDWAGDQIASSGRFATPGLDLAAAFGPARGVAGTVEFTDLIGLVTAPDQRLKIAAINPGIEVADGVLRFALQPGHVLAIEGAEWPFLSGRLSLRPTRMTLGAEEVRRYVLDVAGIDAAQFLLKLDMANLGATGHFDGTLPLVFDANGGRIEHGLLTSRPPGGNVSYVGALTYKDLSPMGNFAFQTLRSLDYRQMRIDMDGSLAGEVVTRFAIEGVRQGAGTRRNFLTRQVARLPIRFNINVRGNFYEVLQSLAATYDPLALCRLLQNRLATDQRARLGMPADCGQVSLVGPPVPKGPNAAQPSVQSPASEHHP